MKCANCGEVIQGNNTSCPYCGNTLIDYRFNRKENDNEDRTILGLYDSEETQVTNDEWTYPDSGNSRSTRNDLHFDNRTGMEFPYTESSHHSFRNNEGVSNSDSQVYYDKNRALSSQQDHFQTNPSPVDRNTTSAYTNSEIPRSNKKSKSVLIILILVIALIAALILSAVLFFKNRTPVLASLTYQELITEYDLSSDDTDSVKTAYHDRVRIDFENIYKSPSGYKATAVIYTPDMDRIYEKTVNESEVINDVQRLSDNELESDRVSIHVDQSQKGLSESSARDLQKRIDQHFLSADEYVKRSKSSVSTPSNNSSSASDQNPAEKESGSNEKTETGVDTAPAPFYGIWCSGSKTESEAKSFIQQHPELSQYNPQIFVTTQWSNLNSKKYYVVTAGTYSRKAEAEALLNNVKQSIPDAYVKYSGDWTG